jgi:hypothetical protein
MKRIKAKGMKVVIYESALIDQGKGEFFHFKVIGSLNDFKKISDVIVANRMVDKLKRRVYELVDNRWMWISVQQKNVKFIIMKNILKLIEKIAKKK